MGTVILKYPAGNVFSVKSAFARLGIECVISDDVDVLRCADHVVVPGQGEASVTMHYLKQTGLDNVIRSLSQPVLGICIGMQLMCDSSEEGNAQCLGIFKSAHVKRFSPQHGEKIPHMGWNSLRGLRGPLFDGIAEGSYAYFVHSYYVPLNSFTAAKSDYCGEFTAAMSRDNFHAVQFHPEKSGLAGEAILKNFLRL